MALPTDTNDLMTYLAEVHDSQIKQLKPLNDEYELKAQRMYMHPEILREVGDRMSQVVVAWPQLVVDSLEERLDVEGFRLPDQADADRDMWRVWQENGADEGSQLAHIDALVMRRAYIAVGTNEEDDQTPLVTFESPLEVYAHVDPRTRKVLAALRRYSDPEIPTVNGIDAPTPVYATLYQPNMTAHYEVVKGRWREVDRDVHNLGTVPVVPLVNRARLSDWFGKSELTPILPLAWAVNKIATDMMVAAEFVALPLRGIFGIGPDDLEDASGNKMTALQAIMGRLLTLPVTEGREFQFTSASLSNFHDTIDKLAQIVAALAGLPPHYLGMAADNPPSADAIRSAEARLVKRAERRQRAFGGAHEQAMRLVRRFQEGDWDPSLRQLETIWRDASTPTIAQKADAALKLYSTPTGPIVPLRQTREDLGYTQAQITRMEGQDTEADAKQAAMFKLPTAAEQLPAPAAAGASA